MTPQELTAEITVPPVLLTPILERLGIVLHRDAKLGPKSGSVSWGPDDTPIISINERETHERQRFTAAHEMGHFLLHMRPSGDKSLQFEDDDKTLVTMYRGADWSPEEYEANN